ncbi:MAG: serine hydrolase domain-containing protein [Allorhizobium sp.]
MEWISRLLKRLVILLALALTAVIAWLSLAPPDLLRVGTGYSAKIVCSNVYLTGREAGAVLASDVQAPGNPLLRLVDVDVDSTQKRVTARFLRLFAPSVAVYRDGFGCTSAGDGNATARASIVDPDVPVPGGAIADVNARWPDGEAVDPGSSRLAAILSDPKLTGPGMRAVVVVKDGSIVAEAYGSGFDANTRLLGWSMTKTVNAAILGLLMRDGRIGFDDADLLPQWRATPNAAVRLKDLLAMESGLAFNEGYGNVSDVTRMLYLEPDMAGFAADKPLESKPGTRFNYSSGTAVILSKIWMNRLADPTEALAFPRRALFGPLGMQSAVMEMDAAGTFVGSSYMYATARDWARFGQFLLQDGVWNGQRLLPEGFVARMQEPSAASNAVYTQIQAWHIGPGEARGETLRPSGDIFWLQGHDGQSIAILPSERLVVVRLGLTPSKLAYRPQLLVKAMVDLLR